MSEQLKFIVQELAKEPFSKNYNLISFDSLEPLQILQVLNDILALIDPKHKIDIREEVPDQTAIRIFQLLRVLKYKPPTEISNLSAFRAGLVQGEKPIIYPILEWMLPRVNDLQKRAYLAKYLVKVEVPAAIMTEEDIVSIYNQYEEIMEQFKELHKQAETLRNSGHTTGEIRKDITNMEDEKEQLIKRIERLRRKVESHPNSQVMMNVAKNLRLERDREKKIAAQRQEQLMNIQHSEQRIKRMQAQLQQIRQAGVGATPNTLMQHLEEETRANGYIVKERLPKDISARKKAVQDLQKVVAVPAMGQSDLDDLNNQITELNSEVNKLTEKRMMSNEPTDDKLSLFRQQAGIIAHKKEAAAERLRDMREEYNHVMQEAEQKRELVKDAEGGEVLKGEDFKRYVNKLRSKSTVYKKKRQELAELRAELGVLSRTELSRTEEILRQRDDHMNAQLSAVERKKGVEGYRQTQEDLEKVSSMKSEVDDFKGRTLDDISDMVRRLHTAIAEKRNTLAPVLRETRPLRERIQQLQPEHENKKVTYDRTAAGLESNMTRLEQEVRGYQEECQAEESRYHYLSSMTNILSIQQAKVQEEMKAYVSSDPQEKKRTMRDLFSKKIQEQENLSRGLRERQKMVRDNHEPNMRQMKMWRDLERLMDCKKSILERGGGAIGGGGGAVGATGGYGEQAPTYHEEDRLVL
ncbi:LOW QUALITY PROTEIN: intraflagellar transport protein 81 homolog [Haliotis rubra]|uniref:LOW QUALITY PROTEIN: intraflagellar transport protein 81 homolog n=1 Tax=Haliotis rubra TaxID=36100 RepID=UPI001EE4EC8C|nr:LOW QUALITY PROTEIN: intraflagellar transport protein 81 homolog [Haliotis rubra]